MGTRRCLPSDELDRPGAHCWRHRGSTGLDYLLFPTRASGRDTLDRREETDVVPRWSEKSDSPATATTAVRSPASESGLQLSMNVLSGGESVAAQFHVGPSQGDVMSENPTDPTRTPPDGLPDPTQNPPDGMPPDPTQQPPREDPTRAPDDNPPEDPARNP